MLKIHNSKQVRPYAQGTLFTRLKSPVDQPTHIATFDTKIVVGSYNGVSLMSENKAQQLEKNLETSGCIAIHDNLIYVLSRPSIIRLYSLDSGLFCSQLPLIRACHRMRIDNNRIYTCGASKIQIYSLSGTLYRAWKYCDSYEPMTIAADNDLIYVADYFSIKIFSHEGKLMQAFGGVHRSFREILIKGKYLYASTSNENRILVFNKDDGTEIYNWKADDLSSPCGLGWYEDYLMSVDGLNNSIKLWK